MRSLRRGLIAGLILGFIVLLLTAFFADLRSIVGRLESFRWSLLPLILAGTLFNYTLRFIKWHYYLGIVGAGDLPRRESARLFVAGFPLALTPAKLGEALKAVWLEQKTGVPVARGLPVVAAERISDGMAVLLLSTLGVLAFPRYWPAFAFLWAILLGIVIISQFHGAVLWTLDRLDRTPMGVRVGRPLRELFTGAYLLLRPKPLVLAIGLGTVAWFGEGVSFFLILIGLGQPATSVTLGLAVFILAFSTAVGAASTLPGGLGAAEASITAMLTLLAGIPLEIAATATLLIRFATLWFGVSLGLATWARSPDLLGLAREATPA
ncbi:MAG TPA: lysylphosphatidylglycerol synthase transmembrane domain-containing protein [Anaerolineales bacterium]|nr:lysylphosphatidylglycerol synthase transmembrane domain-containing protein [Anaerolineales bacterium]